MGEVRNAALASVALCACVASLPSIIYPHYYYYYYHPKKTRPISSSVETQVRLLHEISLYGRIIGFLNFPLPGSRGF
jgi:hypothetical protein